MPAFELASTKGLNTEQKIPHSRRAPRAANEAVQHLSGQEQRFLSAHDQIHNIFQSPPDHVNAAEHPELPGPKHSR